MEKRFIYYDTETTGVNTREDRIVEIAAFDKTNNTTFSFLVNPSMPIPPGASNVHHITDSMVKDAPTFDVIGKKFTEFVGENGILVAHNNDGFDLPLLKSEYARHGIEMPNAIFLDSLRFARKYRPDLPRHTLQHLREHYGFPANNAHRALDDVIILEQVFSTMIDDLSPSQVYELCMKKQEVKTMPFGKHRGKLLSKVPKNYVKFLLDNGAFDKPQNEELKEAFQKVGSLS
ncbi:DNA polymerase III subunit epsilon [Candidatus Aerophobetes bacterium]|uniref:DNA polymerase III subunit epsilon n=1 Tax=Aerophobetes bacterium TaxID=2030807 RepID=A0A2A4X7S0_UNCAE|nr:MAG: DNA polymerase III subunit epsilon [Candidatus Aerophobetes bacterium]